MNYLKNLKDNDEKEGAEKGQGKCLIRGFIRAY